MENCDYIRTARLKEYTGDTFFWGGNLIKQSDIKDGILSGITEQHEQYDDFAWLKGTLKSDEWHIGRIVYFVNHPDKIKPIQIDNKCCDGIITAIPFIEDGHHRFMAQIYLKFEKIPIIYAGRCDVLEYLKGAMIPQPTN